MAFEVRETEDKVFWSCSLGWWRNLQAESQIQMRVIADLTTEQPFFLTRKERSRANINAAAKGFFLSRNGTRLVHSLKSGLKLGRCSHFMRREKEKGETERKTLGIKEVSGLRWELRGQGRGLEKMSSCCWICLHLNRKDGDLRTKKCLFKKARKR